MSSEGEQCAKCKKGKLRTIRRTSTDGLFGREIESGTYLECDNCGHKQTNLGRKQYENVLVGGGIVSASKGRAKATTTKKAKQSQKTKKKK